MRAAGLALTLNVVPHRDNIDHVAAIVARAEEVDAQRLELANALVESLRARAAASPPPLIPRGRLVHRP